MIESYTLKKEINYALGVAELQLGGTGISSNIFSFFRFASSMHHLIRNQGSEGQNLKKLEMG